MWQYLKILNKIDIVSSVIDSGLFDWDWNKNWKLSKLYLKTKKNVNNIPKFVFSKKKKKKKADIFLILKVEPLSLVFSLKDP